MSLLTIKQHLDKASKAFEQAGSSSPSLDAQVLLTHVLNKPRSYLLTWPEKILEAEFAQAFDALVVRRLQGEPIAYIVGEREFWSLPLKVSTATLIPRPDSESLVELAIEKLKQDNTNAPILDLGTGTGAIALALAYECPKRHVFAVDISPEAVELARENAQRCKLANVTFMQGSWFLPWQQKGNDAQQQARFACIVSNPPYIDEQDPHLAQGDVRFEPKTALVAAENGLADLRHIATQARDYLLENAWLLMEHGYQQGQQVRDIMQTLGYQKVTTAQDYQGQDRVTLGQYSSSLKR